MKKLLLMFAAVATLFTACNKETECNHEFIEVDYSKTLVGTWTCLEADYAAAFVFNADGTAFTTGVENGEYWENVKVNWEVVNNKLTLSYEDNTSETLLEIITGEYLSISDKNGDRRKTYKYCTNDLSEEILGMWVCNDSPSDVKNDISIISYEKDGSTTFTGILPNSDDYMVKVNTTYKVVGDLMFKKNADKETSNSTKYISTRLAYTPNGTAAGDIMVYKHYTETLETSSTYLRIKQNLDLAGNKYDYIKTFVTNVKGEDKDIPFLNTSFNFAKMDGSIIDKFLKSILFTVEFPEANKIQYNYLLEGQNIVIEAPIAVEGNKMTIKMSANNPVYQDVDVYTFQDQDNTQMHMYMHTTSFEKFFANTAVAVMLGNGQLNVNDTEAIADVYKTIADAVESINLSLVMSKTK